MPNLRKNINNKNHFDKTAIWYSTIFDKYLMKHGITDIEDMDVWYTRNVSFKTDWDIF